MYVAETGGCTACVCDPRRMIANTACDPRTGQCQCVLGGSGVGGLHCDSCLPGYWMGTDSSATRSPCATRILFIYYARSSRQTHTNTHTKPNTLPQSTYHLTDLLTARGVAHLVVHGTSGSTSYETIPPVRKIFFKFSKIQYHIVEVYIE